MVENKEEPKQEEFGLAKASSFEGTTSFGGGYGSFMMPANSIDEVYQKLGLTPEKLVIPQDYHQVIQMVYDFYQRGGVVATVVNRLAELSITGIRNGQRKTTDEQNAYFEAVLHRAPSRLMRFLRTMSLEYYLSGMVIPRVEFEQVTGEELSPELVPTKKYWVPKFDLYPPSLITVVWAGWGKKDFYLKIPKEDIKNIRNKGSRTKEQQLRFDMWNMYYPKLVEEVLAGKDQVNLEDFDEDIDPILRKEISYSPYPVPYIYNVLEPLVYKQQLRRMDFAVASRVINAILLVKEGNDNYPITEETRGNLDELKMQILARAGNPRLIERLFMLFSNHTTTLEWITPDVTAMLDQEKYKQTNEELTQGLGFTMLLITGESRSTGTSSEVSTWAIQPMMEELRANMIEWITWLYEELSEQNKFRNTPVPMFKPIRLQDFVKTAAVFSQLFTEGSLSRTTRTELLGTDFETEVELMKDEVQLMEGLPPFPPMPYSPLPPVTGPGGKPAGKPGRPQGSQNVPVNNRNTGVKPPGQKPLSKVKQSSEEIVLMDDETLVDKLIALAEDRGLVVSKELIDETPELMNE